MNKFLLTSAITSLGVLGFACSESDPIAGADAFQSGGSTATGGATSTGGGDGIGAGGSANSGGSAGVGGTFGDGAGGLGAGGGSSAGGAMGAGGTPPVDEPTLITSGPDAGYWNEGELTMAGTTPTITVNPEVVLAEWHGFGGTFNEAGWDALKVVSEADRALALVLLFHPYEGAAFTYGRIPIGASDYALDRYTLNETANDYAMTNFSIERDKRDLIPYIKAALDVKPDIRLWASPWTPPTWMKTPAGFDGGTMKNDAQTLAAHALYLARFVEEYEEDGIHIEAVHPQNEPGYQQGYPSCGWNASQMTGYIANHLGPLFAERLPDVEVWLGTMSNPTDTSIVTTVMNDATARGYVKGIGAQWGQVDSAQSYVENYDVPVMQTEHQCGNYPWNGGNPNMAPNDYAYALESWQNLQHWISKGINSYLAWNMVLDTVGRNLDTSRPWAQNALLAVNRSTGQLIITPAYYVFRHYSQYVEPGSVRVQTTGGDASAWKNPDGSVVTVLRNGENAPAMITVSVGGTMMQAEVPARGWATFNWQG